MDRKILHKWLKSGYVENTIFYPTEEGTMQGGTISPTIANIVLDGMENLVQGIAKESDKINFVRYADDCARREPQFKPVKVRSRKLAMDPCSVGTGMIG
jgi:hypothetical protein